MNNKASYWPQFNNVNMESNEVRLAETLLEPISPTRALVENPNPEEQKDPVLVLPDSSLFVPDYSSEPLMSSLQISDSPAIPSREDAKPSSVHKESPQVASISSVTPFPGLHSQLIPTSTAQIIMSYHSSPIFLSITKN